MRDGDDPDVLVIGAGPAGLSCALWCARLGLRARLVEAGARAGGGLLAIRGNLPDYLGFAGGGPALADAGAAQLLAAGVSIEPGIRATRLDAGEARAWAGDRPLPAGHVVLATGGRQRALGMPGEGLLDIGPPPRVWAGPPGGRAVVIGGGDRAAERACLLAETGARVTLVHRGAALGARAALRLRLGAPAAGGGPTRVLLGTRVLEILAAPAPYAALVEGPGGREILPADLILAHIGLQANTELCGGGLAILADGRLATDARGRTSRPRIWAAGDVCCDPALSCALSAAAQGAAVARAIAAG